MSDTVIRVENLGKKYVIGHQQEGERYTALRDVVANGAKGFAKRFNPLKSRSPFPTPHSPSEDFWALKDVSFDIKQGDRVGIIGRNGAGKSTLLKILSRITEPTKGRIKIRGRVASLLEVGTGFHPELTGRENIYLNGAILGMSKAEIRRKFDEIVAFAEVERFLDTPVKRYSSGMYVRLAFAVAAHLEPEILIVDEVLAVGDAQFQKKCLGKMQDVAGEGRTVIFVSHNMAAVSALCSKAMVLKEGVIQSPLESVHTAMEAYLEQIKVITADNLSDRKDRKGEGKVKITHFSAFDRSGNEQAILLSGQYTEFRIYYASSKNFSSKNAVAGISINQPGGGCLTELSNQFASQELCEFLPAGYISCIVNKLPLSPGNYSINLILRDGNTIQDWVQEAVTLSVECGDFYGTGKLTTKRSCILVDQKWASKLMSKTFV